jgi:hypothetical protein
VLPSFIVCGLSNQPLRLQGNSRSNPEALRRRVENLLKGQVIT